MYELMRIKRSGSICWFYSCNSFYIFLNAILSLDNNSVTKRYQPCFTTICLNTRPQNKPTFSLSRSPRQSFIFVYLFIYFSTETSTTSSYLWIFMFEIFHLNVPYMRRLTVGFFSSYRSIWLTQFRTQFKPFGYKTFCFRNFHII